MCENCVPLCLPGPGNVAGCLPVAATVGFQDWGVGCSAEELDTGSRSMTRRKGMGKMTEAGTNQVTENCKAEGAED